MKLLRVAVIVLLVAGAGAAVVFGLPDLRPQPERVPTTRAQRGDVDARVHTLGELGPRRAIMLSAPANTGMLQLVTLLPAGTLVQEGTVVLAFDPAEQQYNLDQARSELEEAEQELVKLDADTRVQAANDQVNLLHARYEVRRAELEVTGNEFVGAIEARKNVLALEEAKRGLAQIQGDVQTHADSNRAARAVLEEKRHKAQGAMQFAQRTIESMVVKAPIPGLVVVKENRDASGGFFFSGMTLPEYREGDTVQPGRAVAEIVDLTEIEIKAKVNETDRPSLATGASAKVSIEGAPALPLTGSTKGVSGLAARAFWDPGAERQFDASFTLNRSEAALRPGMTARVVIAGERLTGVQHLPRQVLFEKEGKPVVYVKTADGFAPTPVKVVRRTESRVVVEGLGADAEVALTNPERNAGGRAARPAAAPAMQGGR
jgi:biotin carboxyl carrier protein